MKSRRDVFQAIADPTRREIINMTANSSLMVSTIAKQFQVTRQAISLHVKILVECGILSIQQKGRERYCKANPEKLIEVYEWVEHFQGFWQEKLSAFKAIAEAEELNKNSKQE